MGAEVEGRRVFVPIPALSNLLLNGHLLGTVQTSSDIGAAIAGADGKVIPNSTLLGWPSDLKAKPQTGVVEGRRLDGGRYRVAWSFAPG